MIQKCNFPRCKSWLLFNVEVYHIVWPHQWISVEEQKGKALQLNNINIFFVLHLNEYYLTLQRMDNRKVF